MKIRALYYAASAYAMQRQAAVATSIKDSILITGTKKLFKNATTALLVLIPVTVGLVCLWHLWQLQGADDNEAAQLKKKIKNKVIYAVIAEAFDALITLIMSYYTAG